MTKKIIFIVFCMVSALASAQHRFPPIDLYTGDPTGVACNVPNSMVQSTTSGGIYACVGGFYVNASGGTAYPGVTSNGNGLNAAGSLVGSVIGALVQADQQTGSDFGQKILNCLAAAKAKGTNVCDARGITGAQSLSADLEFTSSNANGMTILLGANLSVTQGTHQVLIDAGVVNFTVKGEGSWATNNGNCNTGGAVFYYDIAATDYAWRVQGTSGSSPVTSYIRLDNIGICVIATGATSTASGLYMGALVQDVYLDRLRIMLPTGSHTVSGNIVPDSTGYSLHMYGGATFPPSYSGLAHINAPEFTGGAGVLVDGNVLANWGQSKVVGGRIQASKMTWPTNSVGQISMDSAGSGCSPGDQITIVQGGASGGVITVNFVDGSGVITGYSVTGDGAGYAVASGLTTTGGTCSVQPVVSILSLGVANRLRFYGGTLPANTQICVSQITGELSMNATDVENCDIGMYVKNSSTVHPYIHPDGGAVKVGIVFDGSAAFGNNFTTSPVHGGTDSAVAINNARANNVNNGTSWVVDSKGAANLLPVGNFDASIRLSPGYQASFARSASIFFSSSFTGASVDKWQLFMDTQFAYRVLDSTVGNYREIHTPGAAGSSTFLSGSGDAFSVGFSAGNQFRFLHPFDTAMNVMLQAGLTADQSKCFNFLTYAGVDQSKMCFSSTGMSYNAASALTSLTLTTPLPVASGGTGTTTPALVAGTGCSGFTGTWPNITINCPGSAGTLYQTFSCVFSLTGNGSYCRWTLPANFTFTRFEIGYNTAPSCTTTYPVISVVNNSGNAIIGDLSQTADTAVFKTQTSTATATSGTVIALRITTTGSGCSGGAAPSATITGHY